MSATYSELSQFKLLGKVLTLGLMFILRTVGEV